MNSPDHHRHITSRRPAFWPGLVAISLILALGSVFTAYAQQNASPTGRVLTIDGAIGPATMDYLVRGIEQAESDGVDLVVIRMDTPGGLMASMRGIIKKILSSDVPVVTWVSPSGARAASAGTYMLYASHVAAMAPATNLGSATPVQMGGGAPGMDSPSENNSPENDEPASEDDAPANEALNSTAMERKVVEDAVSYIRGLAERHGRNADWAESAVRDAVNLGASEALAQNVVDVLAKSLPDLMEQLDGRTVVMNTGDQVLTTQGIELERIDQDWRTKLLSVITDPNVAYFLMIIGFYGIFFELASPGSVFPGVIGAICLILALFAFQVLPVNYAGLALILLGLALIVGEAFVASFGILGIGGIAAFVVGSIILMDGSHQDISLPTIGGTAAVGAGFILWTVVRFMGLRNKQPVSGPENLARETVVALADFRKRNHRYAGHVQLHGERWNALSDHPVRAGDQLHVQSIDGLTVEVGPGPADSLQQ